MPAPRSLSEFLRSAAPWLAAGFLLTFASSFGQTFFISVFAGEIRAAFGLSHGGWGSLYALATMSSAVVMVLAGGVTDHVRVRVIGAVVIAGLALAALAMAAAPAVWALALAVFLLRLMGQGMLGHTAMVAMARWFTASRGRALSVAGLGVAMGEALLPLLFVALLGLYDWRLLWVAVAGGLVLLLPVLWRLLREERTPQSFAEEARAAGLEGRSWTRAEMLRHGLFWAMVPLVLGPAAWNTSFFFHQVHIAEVTGWGHGALVALFPVYTAASIGMMLLSGWAVDRFGATRLAGVYMLPGAAGYGLLGLADGLGAAALTVVLIGMSAGLNTTMSGAFWAEVYGTRHIGAIRATLAGVMVLGTALGPAITGTAIDLGVSFPAQGFAIGLYFALASLLAGRAAHLAGRRLPPRG